MCSTRGGRVNELRRLITSIEESSYHGDRELLVVDQGSNRDLAASIGSDVELPIRYLASEGGLSRGRNAGLSESSQPVVAFPDDDCWYPPSTLETAISYLNEGALVVVGSQVDPTTGSSLLRFPARATTVTRANVLRTGIEFAMFVRRDAFEQSGGFDVTLGVGSSGPYQAGEGTDLLLRLIELGPVVYRPDVVVYHPTASTLTSEKAEPYGLGIGYALGRHEFPAIRVATVLLRRLAKSMVLMLKVRIAAARLALSWARGLAVGYIRGRRHRKSPSV